MSDGAVRVILTGARGCGKTRTCEAVVDELRGRGWKVAGVLSAGVWTAGEKVAIDALDLHLGETRRLAERAGGEGKPAGPATPGWHFHAVAVDWCNSILAHAGETDLLVVDELGPLEWEQHRGLLQGMQAVDAGRFRMGLIVVRPRLLETARRRWPDARVVRIDGPAELRLRVGEILSLAGPAQGSAGREGWARRFRRGERAG